MTEPFQRNRHLFSIRIGKFQIVFQTIINEGGIDIFKQWLRDSEKTNEKISEKNESS